MLDRIDRALNLFERYVAALEAKSVVSGIQHMVLDNQRAGYTSAAPPACDPSIAGAIKTAQASMYAQSAYVAPKATLVPAEKIKPAESLLAEDYLDAADDLSSAEDTVTCSIVTEAKLSDNRKIYGAIADTSAGEGHPTWAQEVFAKTRKGNGRTTGFIAFMQTNAATWLMASEEQQAGAKDKWKTLYPGVPFPKHEKGKFVLGAAFAKRDDAPPVTKGNALSADQGVPSGETVTNVNDAPPVEKPVSKEEVRAALMKLRDAKGLPAVTEILKTYGANNVSAVDQFHFKNILKRVGEALNV